MNGNDQFSTYSGSTTDQPFKEETRRYRSAAARSGAEKLLRRNASGDEAIDVVYLPVVQVPDPVDPAKTQMLLYPMLIRRYHITWTPVKDEGRPVDATLPPSTVQAEVFAPTAEDIAAERLMNEEEADNFDPEDEADQDRFDALREAQDNIREAIRLIRAAVKGTGQEAGCEAYVIPSLELCIGDSGWLGRQPYNIQSLITALGGDPEGDW